MADIPDAAVQAAKEVIWAAEEHFEGTVCCMAEDVRDALEAALPHLPPSHVHYPVCEGIQCRTLVARIREQEDRIASLEQAILDAVEKM